MASWTGRGPISLPPRPLAYGAGGLVVVAAVAALALGFRASIRQPGAPGAINQTAVDDADTLTARPIVELPPPVPEAETAAKDADSSDAADAKALASQTAEAQAIQAKSSKPGGDIDAIMTSPTEKPPSPVKAPADETPPGAPVKSDVPF